MTEESSGRLAQLRERARAQEQRIRRVPRTEGARHLVSYGQERLWFITQADPADASYNVPVGLRLRGPLSVPALQQALRVIIGRHEILRTVYETTADGCRQIVAWQDAGFFELPVRDCAGEQAAYAAAVDLLRRPFDLTSQPPVRAELLRLADDDHLLVACVHHIAFDGDSVGVLLDELGANYRAALGQGGARDAEPVQYVDYAAAQRLDGELDRQVDWWRARLAGAPALDLPVDRARPEARAHRGGMVGFTVPAAAAEALRKLAREQGTSAFAVLLTVFMVLLRRYSGQSDISVGTPVTVRDSDELDSAVGLYVNTLVLRADLSGDLSFSELVRRVRDVVLDALAHREAPFEKVVEAVNPDRVPGRHPLFQVLFSTGCAPCDDLGWSVPGLRAQPERLSHGLTKVDLSVHLEMRADGSLRGSWQFDAALFDEPTARRMAAHFVRLAGELAQDGPVNRAAMLDEAELRELATAWNDPPAPAADVRLDDVGVHELFLRQAALTPDAPAVRQGPRVLTYGEVARWSRAIAAELPTDGTDLVGICVPREVAGVVALLGVLLAGRAYLPLDLELPPARLRFALEDAGVRTVLVHGSMPENLRAALRELPEPPRVLDIGTCRAERPVEPAPGGSRPCYVIYTSGTTGRPKGVVLEHRALTHYTTSLLSVLRRELGGQLEGLNYATVSTLGADLGNTSIFAALAGGGCVHVVDYETATDPARFSFYLEEHGIDVLKIVPSHFEALYRGTARPRLPRRALILGGEAPTRTLITDVLAEGSTCRIFNHYGPTETCIGSLIHPVGPDADDPSRPLPVGRPLGATTIAILDEQGLPVPQGVTGELYIAGPGVARGYLHRPELTAERFVEVRGASGTSRRHYRTGDLARTLPDGNIEFVGRRDTQVKVRGHRVELSEVEAALASHRSVSQAVVTAASAGLSAYVVATAPIDTDALAAELRESLPGYMVPSSITLVTELPRNLNGKIDFDRLRASGPVSPRRSAPATPMELWLLEAWAQLLERPVEAVDQDFFAAGGHSLLLIRLVGRIRAELGLEASVRQCFAHPTVRTLAAELERTGATAEAGILRTARAPGERHPVSFVQERLWFLQRLTPDSAAYNVPIAVRLRGPLDCVALASAVRAVVTRHEALRTRYEPAPDGCRQVVAYPDGRFLAVPVRAAPDEDTALEMASQLAALPFDLAAGPPVRAELIRLAEDHHLLVLSVHHIAIDGWSVGVLSRHLRAAYLGLPVPASPVQYLDFARWQREHVTGERLSELLAWWRDRLGGARPLELPLDRLRPAVQAHRGACVQFELDAATGAALRQVAERHGATSFMILLSVFLVLLRRHTGHSDLSVGTVVAGRDRPEVDDVVGPLVNTVVLRADLGGDPSFGELLDRVRQVVLDALAHQDAPFEKVVEAVNPVRDLSYSPLFQVAFGVGVPGSRAVAWSAGGLEAEPLALPYSLSKYDMSVDFADQADGSFTGWWHYDAALFDRETIAAMAERFVRLATAFAGKPFLTVAIAPMLGADELDALLAAPNQTAVQNPDLERGVHELILGYARKAPHAEALRQGGRVVTYGELDTWSAAVAAQLSGGLIGVCAQRIPDTVIAIVGVLRSGGAYVPLDPQLPSARLRQIIADAGLREILVAGPDAPGNLADAIEGTSVRLVDIRDPAPNRPASFSRVPSVPAPGGDRLCYVLYTSGSTGRPKGVLVPHRGVVNYVTWACAEYGIAEGSPVLLHSPITFDLTVTTMLAPLVAGARVEFTAGEEVADLLAALAGAAQPYQVVKVTPAHLRLLNTALADVLPHRAPTRCLVVGGEALTLDAVRPWLDHSRVINEYGPTEATVGCTIFDVAEDPTCRDVPIGRPIANTTAYVLDERLQPVPTGVMGELFIGGLGLAHGYLNRPELTAERFVPHPYEPGARLYRTGDLAVRRHDGVLEYRGRDDGQVKIRGHRVELGEIESVIKQIPGIGDACVIRVEQAGFDGLVAHVGGQTVTPHTVRAALRKTLPAYMIPDRISVRAELPLTPNGKLDRAALLRDLPAAEEGARSAAVAGETEQRLHRLWAEVLGRARIGRTENFFDAGGHSLLMVDLHARIIAEFGEGIELLELFRSPSIAALAAVLDGRVPQKTAAPVIRPSRAGALANLRRRKQGNE
ncbi:amino acid adenylation domain-containing protein [Nonomuraea sp. NPDC049400]|uniref:amino acid adenylation domain-containing protein n=1 Tax=Nonomuraea sp. NPDC049400 TaxID=3364352 RepID=UPI00379AA6F5